MPDLVWSFVVLRSVHEDLLGSRLKVLNYAAAASVTTQIHVMAVTVKTETAAPGVR